MAVGPPPWPNTLADLRCRQEPGHAASPVFLLFFTGRTEDVLALHLTSGWEADDRTNEQIHRDSARFLRFI
jgi:hypothetical protein